MKREEVREIAKQRVATLFRLAAAHPQRAQRYVALARRVAARVRMRLPASYRRKFCRWCNSLWSAKTVKVRLNRATKAVEYRCLVCGRISRWPYAKERLKRRAAKQ